MMKSRWRSVALVLILVLIAAISFGCLRNEYIRCMGVRVITPEQAAAYTDYAYQDLSSLLLMDGQPAAVDVEHSTLYISQNSAGKKTYRDLDGQLQISSGRYQLYFVLEREDLQLEQAMAQNVPFRLLVTDGSTRYMEYDVIFTSLPVISLNGQMSHVDQENREVMDGSFCLWSATDPVMQQYAAKAFAVQWRVRGRTSAVLLDKKSYKVSLTGKDLDLQGLGKSGDWILNSLGFDDTLLREKLFMNLWNDLTAETTHNYPMSKGEYVELVLNGEYSGIYLLQRRIDGKYLGLADEDILFKTTTYAASSLEGAYEIVYAKTSSEYAYAQMADIYHGGGSDILDINNLIDTNLFLQFAEALDNYAFKNMYHLLKYTAEGYRHYLIPWDTDMSFGLTWQEGVGLVYDYDSTVNGYAVRRETRAVPDIDADMAARWSQLRTSVLSQENINRYLEQELMLLQGSGAYVRNSQVWAERHAGEDTLGNLYRFIGERLVWLDDYYANMNR